MRHCTPPVLAALVCALAIACVVALSGTRGSSASGGPGIISAGYNHTCVLLSSGGVQCAGGNAYGQLGDGGTADSATPVGVCSPGGCGNALSGVRSVSSGREHTCVLTSTGGVLCWGANFAQQLGNNSDTQSSIPVTVSGLSSGVTQLSAGRYYTCAVTNAGGAKCWGSNVYGQLGDGTTAERGVPTDVAGLTSGVKLVETERYHSCALLTSGRVKCWGDNVDGQLGHPGIASSLEPVDVCTDQDCNQPLQNIAAISLGLHSTCALTTSGGVKCWGKNDFGQLGDGTMQRSDVPVNAFGLTSGVRNVSVGESNVCVLPLDIEDPVKCWGDNRFGQLGNGTTINNAYPAELCSDASCTTPLASVAAISAAAHHVCMLTDNAAIRCWGANTYGQIGDGTTVSGTAATATLFAGTKPAPTPTASPTSTPTRTATAVPTPTPTAAVATGDANCDDVINSIDAALVLQHGAGLLAQLPCSEAGDANRDGTINSLDAALILQYAAGLLPRSKTVRARAARS